LPGGYLRAMATEEEVRELALALSDTIRGVRG
jgi:hypothetical protein